VREYNWRNSGKKGEESEGDEYRGFIEFEKGSFCNLGSMITGLTPHHVTPGGCGM
jgi:hypothetical protein